MIEGVDKYNNLFASLLLPPATPGGPNESLAELLVKDGLAKVRRGMWEGYRGHLKKHIKGPLSKASTSLVAAPPGPTLLSGYLIRRYP